MKNFLLTLSALVFFSCNKTADSAKDSVAKHSEPYMGLDGTRAKATFTNENGKEKILMEANGQKLELDRKADEGKRKVYERNGVRIEQEGDSMWIKQDNVIIPLVHT